MVSLPKIAVVGAGVAGITAASQLHAAGFPVTLFDKSRGLGGRLATRRWPTGVAFDHGAPYFGADDAAFKAALEASKAATTWQPRVQGTKTGDMWVGNPRMNAWLKDAATGINTKLNTTISGITANAERWTLSVDKRKAVVDADIVVLATPSPQAAQLAAEDTELAARLDAITYTPVWTILLSLNDHNAIPCDVIADTPADSPLAWLGRNAGKPGRDVDNTGWVAHARAEWSAENLEITTDAAIAKLAPAVITALGCTREAVQKTQAHRWRYANVSQSAGEPYLQNAKGSLFAIGDGCLGGGVEGAYQSGDALAKMLIAAHTEA